MRLCFKTGLFLLRFIAFLMLHDSAMASEAVDAPKRMAWYQSFFLTKPFCQPLNGWNWPKKQRASDKQILTSDEKKVSQWIIDNSSCVKRDNDFMLNEEDEEYLYEQGSQRDLSFVNQQDNQIRPLDNKSMKYNFSVESDSLANYWDLLRQGIVGLYEGQLGFVHDLFSSKQAAKIKKAFDRSNFKKRRPGLISSDLEKAVCLLLNKEIDASISKWKDAIETVEEKLRENFVMIISTADVSWNENEEVAVRKRRIDAFFDDVLLYDSVMHLRDMLYYFLTITMEIQKDKSRIEKKEISPQTINLIDAEQSDAMNNFLKRIENVGFLDRYFLKKDLAKLKKPIQEYIMTTAQQKIWDQIFTQMKTGDYPSVRSSTSNAYDALKNVDIHLANTWQSVHNGLILKKNGFKKLADSFLHEALTELEQFEESSAYIKMATAQDNVQMFVSNFYAAIQASLSTKTYKNEWGNLSASSFFVNPWSGGPSASTALRKREPWWVLTKARDFFKTLIAK